MLEINTLEDIEGLDESVSIECKLAQGRDGKGALPKDFWESYSAFANTEGGTVLLGIKEKADGKFLLAGIENPKRIIDELWAGLNNPQKVSANILRDKWVQVKSIGGLSYVHIHIPRAPWKYQPVFICGNPLTGTYKRFGSGDSRVEEEQVKRMLAEQVLPGRDERIVKGYGLSEIDTDSLSSYYNMFRAYKPGHPWLDLDQQAFLEKIGGWGKDEEHHQEGLTAAGFIVDPENETTC